MLVALAVTAVHILLVAIAVQWLEHRKMQVQSLNTFTPTKLASVHAQMRRKIPFIGLCWLISYVVLLGLTAHGITNVYILVANFAIATVSAIMLLRIVLQVHRIGKFGRGTAIKREMKSGTLQPGRYHSRETNVAKSVTSLPSTEVKRVLIVSRDQPHETTSVLLPLPVDSRIRFKSLREAKTFIVGQDAAITAIDQELRLACSGLIRRDDRPLTTFLLTGPTGVGKTETAYAIAEVTYGQRDRVAVFSMNEAQGEGGCWRAFGPPPGYKDSNTGGLLTNQIKRHSGRCVVLIDEVEKGPTEVLDALLTGLDTGYFTESLSGERVDIRECVVVMTTNAMTAVDVNMSEHSLRDQLASTRRDGQVIFRPEFLGRIKRVLHYGRLDALALGELCRLRYRHNYAKNIANVLGTSVLHLSDNLVSYLTQEISNSAAGVRGLDGLLERTILTAALNMSKEALDRSIAYCWQLVPAENGLRIELAKHII